MAAARANWRCIAVVVLAGTLASVAHGASYTVSWGFNTSAVFVPELAVNCGDNVTFRLAANQTHDVVQVVPVVPSLARFPSVCNASQYRTLVPRQTLSAPLNFTQRFNSTGAHYFICSVVSPRNHCSFGKMALKVTVVGECPDAPPPAPPPRRYPPRPPPATPPPPPARVPQTIVQNWAFDVASTTAVQAQCNDTVLFRSTGGRHDVVEVDSSSCNGNFVLAWQDITVGAFNATVPMNKNGLRTFICTVNNHCQAGMLINVNTTGC